MSAGLCERTVSGHFIDILILVNHRASVAQSAEQLIRNQ